MDIAFSIKNNILFITPLGKNLDATTVQSFKEKVLQLIQQENLSNVIFDLSHLRFIDSTGLGVFLAFHRQLSKEGGMVKLAKVDPSIQTIFEIVPMNRFLDIFPTIEEAIQSF